MTLNTVKKEQQKYIQMLENMEMSQSTIKKYSLSVQNFIQFAEDNGHLKKISKDCLIKYKGYLQEKYKPATSNLYISGLNNYLHYLGDGELKIKSLKIQHQNILENCFTSTEYWAMLEVAKKQKDNTIYYIIRTLANTGMRIKGLPYVTVEIIKKGNFIATNKGKTRCIVIPQGICDELLEFCEIRGITSGYIFRGQNPKKSISQTTVKRWIKKIALIAGVDNRKAYPHNFRHLFAMTFMDKYGNLSELADILGHSSIETTRIYTRSGIEEKRRKMENIGL